MFRARVNRQQRLSYRRPDSGTPYPQGVQLAGARAGIEPGASVTPFWLVASSITSCCSSTSHTAGPRSGLTITEPVLGQGYPPIQLACHQHENLGRLEKSAIERIRSQDGADAGMRLNCCIPPKFEFLEVLLFGSKFITMVHPMNAEKVLFGFIAASGILALFAPASEAATVRFTPPGAQLDGDPILDIILYPGQPISFANFFSNQNDTLPTNLLEYTITYDPAELSYVNSQLDSSNKFALSETFNNVIGSIGVRHIQPPTSPPTGVNPQAEFLLDVFNFVGVNPGRSPHDGLVDYSFAGANFFDDDDVSTPTITISNFSSNTVEVQRVPGPLPLLGVGAVFGYSRKLRKRIKRSTTPDIMSAIG
jgi:hypothetical protein